MSRIPGPVRPDPFASLTPGRTPGPLGRNDAADPSANAHPGDTRSILGVNDGAAHQLIACGPMPARLLAVRNVVAATPSGRIRTAASLKIQVPKAAEVKQTHSGNVSGGGRFSIHHSGMMSSGTLIPKAPSVTVVFNKSTQVYEIRSIVIYTLKVMHAADPKSLPVVGKNVTNNKALRARTPLDDVNGKGYWEDVIKNMAGYQYGGDPNQYPPALQWYAAGSSEFHEEVHYQQFRSWMAKNNDSVLRQIMRRLGRLNQAQLSEKAVAKAVQSELQTMIHSGSGSGTDEDEAYKKTYAKIWVPVIQKIKDDAKAQGWVKGTP